MGVNVTEIVQLVLPASVPPHGDVPPPTAAKFALAPIESDVLTLLVFDTVTILAALVVPTVCDANVSVAGETVTVAGVEVPVPVRVTF